MPKRIRERLKYANVVSTLALFIALGGSSYAALSIGSKEIRDKSVRGKDIRNRTLTGTHVKKDRLGGGAIKERSLAQVPSAGDSDRLSGRTIEQVLLSCPPGLILRTGLCFEPVASGPVLFDGALGTCEGRGRTIPSYTELAPLLTSGQAILGAGGEFTSDVFIDGDLRTVVITDGSGATTSQSVDVPNSRRYRCVVRPSN